MRAFAIIVRIPTGIRLFVMHGEEFVAHREFGSRTVFNRIDVLSLGTLPIPIQQALLALCSQLVSESTLRMVRYQQS